MNRTFSKRAASLLPLASATLALAFLTPTVHALDLTGGTMQAVPVKGGIAPTIDSDLRDWDLSGEEPVYITPQTARPLHALVALEYDNDALYVGAQVSLPGRPIRNPNDPVDAFWNGDILEFRLVSDPSLPEPLNPGAPAAKASDRVAHLSFWKNSASGKDWLNITYGVGLDKGSAVNPAGTRLVIKANGTSGYTLEARVPWSELHVPCGRIPFAVGGKMTAVWGVHWGGETQTAALYRANPGAFAFMQSQTWGQVEFSPRGNLKPRHETLNALLAGFEATVATGVGAPITVHVPADGLKVSVNILGPRGEVVRELMGGEPHPKGPLVVRWDGRDQWGAPVALGTYKWGAYFSPGLKAQFVGAVGTSDQPPFETEDGRGGWGGDHGACIDVAADATGLYFLWVSAEDGRAVVKTDYDGKVLWRKTPFVGGGFGPLYAIASNGKAVFITFGDNDPQLLRLDATSGQLLTFPGGAALAPISKGNAVKVGTAAAFPLGTQAESVGIAATANAVFTSVYGRNLVQLLDPNSGAPLRTLAVPGPRGLCVDKADNLFVVSFVEGQAPRIMRFAGGQGEGVAVVTSDLSAPWDVAVDADGNLHVTDDGASQQLKTFNIDGHLLRTQGKLGGRTWAGSYDPNAFLNPAGIAIDARGGLLVAEAAPPKVMSRFDARSGKLLARWFGHVAYATMAWPDPTDPHTAYYTLEGPPAIARATVPPNGNVGAPTAYWALRQAGVTSVDSLIENIAAPEVMVAANGEKYLVSDTGVHGIALVRGDSLPPVASASVGNVGGKTTLELWSDTNGDRRTEPDETTTVDSVGGAPLPPLNNTTGSMHMEPNGDLYLLSSTNSILKIPAAGFTPDGAIRWDATRASLVVPQVLDVAHLGANGLGGGWRQGLLGVRRDGVGNLYVGFNTSAKYATPELSKAMQEGLGHTGEVNAVKFAKFAPDGHLLWMAGRKATAAARPGEMYHFWVLAGLVGGHANERVAGVKGPGALASRTVPLASGTVELASGTVELASGTVELASGTVELASGMKEVASGTVAPASAYIAGASEWGQITFYTGDGFFVGALMNNPGLAPPAGPYTFGSETFGGRVVDFGPRGVWAYQAGRIFQVAGFQNGRIVGESRAAGTVRLDHIYDSAPATVAANADPLHIVALTGADPIHNARAWQNVPTSTLSRNGEELATAQLGYDARTLYGRFHVQDSTPGQNVADTLGLVFKGGDTVGITLGPGPTHDAPRVGDLRILIARIGGRPRLIVMKPLTNGKPHPERYRSPVGDDTFAFVGEVPGGAADFVPDADGKGYTASFALPRTALEFALKPGATLRGDVEVRLSGQGARGPQTVSRNYLFTPRTGETTMTDDIPTEARLYPQYFGPVEVR